MIQRVLDFGAVGTIAPMVNTRKDAELFVAAAKYPTLGERSYGPRHAAMVHGIKDVGDYVASANANTITLAQIETREAYENLDEILAVDGLDGVLMGPQDFAIFMEERLDPKPYGPETVDAVRIIAEKTRAAGKLAAAFTASGEHAKLVQSFGYQLVSLALDTQLIAFGAAKVLSEAKD